MKKDCFFFPTPMHDRRSFLEEFFGSLEEHNDDEKMEGFGVKESNNWLTLTEEI